VASVHLEVEEQADDAKVFHDVKKVLKIKEVTL